MPIFSITSWQPTVLGILPFLDRWEIYARAGMSFWDATSRQRLVRVSDGLVVNQSVDDDGLDFLLGFGGGVTLRQRWHIRAEYLYYGIDDDLMQLPGDESAYVDVLSVQLLYRFGALPGEIPDGDELEYPVG